MTTSKKKQPRVTEVTEEPLSQPRIDPQAFETMRSFGGTWAAYECQAMDSGNLGHLQFLHYGPGCTFLEAPKRMPDTKTINWSYVLIGTVNFENGEIDS